jgi:hypothetical protein
MKIDTNLFYDALQASNHDVSKEQVRGRLKNHEYAWYDKWFAVRLQQQLLQQQLEASQDPLQHQPPPINNNNNNSNNATPSAPGQLALTNPHPRSAGHDTPKEKEMDVESESGDDDYEESDDDESDQYKPPRKKYAIQSTQEPAFLPPCCAHEFPEVIVTEEYCYVVMTKSPRRLISMGVCLCLIFFSCLSLFLTLRPLNIRICREDWRCESVSLRSLQLIRTSHNCLVSKRSSTTSNLWNPCM